MSNTPPAVTTASYYQQQCRMLHYAPDLQQMHTIEQLQHAEDQWLPYTQSVWRRWLLPTPRHLYLWGPVGRGKSFVMNCFYHATKLQPKQRTHFHDFMKYIHEHLRTIHRADPLKIIARKISCEYRVLCFDEFHVNDIADAMILSNLLQALSQEHLCILTTSNYAPHDLYRDGLQRELFLPTIRLIEKTFSIYHLDSGQDYRTVTPYNRDRYFYPHNAAATTHLAQLFHHCSLSNQCSGSRLLLGRPLHYVGEAAGVIWLTFEETCGTARSQLDYLELAKHYHTILLSHIPEIAPDYFSQARRLTWFIDVCYEKKIILYVSAATTPEKIYSQGILSHEFARTVSRLNEMCQSLWVNST